MNGFTYAAPPTVVTAASTGITATGATLNGSVNPNLSSTNWSFEYGATTNYGSTTPVQTLGSGNISVAIASIISGLACNTPYHFRGVANNAGGPATGLDATFTTAACPLRPSVVTGLASGISARVATLNRTANPNRSATTAFFGRPDDRLRAQPVSAGSGNVRWQSAVAASLVSPVAHSTSAQWR